MTDLFILIALIVIVSILGVNTFKIAEESERFAVFYLGRFQAYKGPGLVLAAPHVQRVVRLKIGDIGAMNGSEFARFGGVDVPVRNVDSLRDGQVVRIEGFDGVEPRLVASSARESTTCPECGHNF